MTRLRRGILVAAIAIALATGVTAQATAQAGEVSTILDLLDAVERWSDRVLAGPDLSAQELAELEALVDAAVTIGAPDLTARVRTLLLIARPSERLGSPGFLPDAVSPVPPPRVYRPGVRATVGAAVLTATGVTTLGLATVFLALSERDYRSWRTAASIDEGERLALAWRTYRLLGVGMGGVSFLSVGVSVPLVHALFGRDGPEAMPLPRPVYTAAERSAREVELLASRRDILERMEAARPLEARRSLVRTIGLGAGTIGAVSTVTFAWLAEQSYRKYVEAPFSDEATSFRNRTSLFDLLSIASGLVAAGGFGTAAGLAVFTDSTADLERELRAVNREIVVLRSTPVAEATESESQ